MRARTGKIARLPITVREELNRRLSNGTPGKELLPWLNDLPAVQQILALRFASRRITEDNLSEWRCGGFQDWLRDQDRRVRLSELARADAHLSADQRAHHRHLQLHERLATELMEELERVSDIKDHTARWKCLQKISREMCRLQRAHLRGKELALFETKIDRCVKVPSNTPGASGSYSDQSPWG
jgi:hypothetical protein